jgi:hypothetical protein
MTPVRAGAHSATEGSPQGNSVASKPTQSRRRMKTSTALTILISSTTTSRMLRET